MKGTFTPNHKEIKQDWHFIDANDKVLGKIAAEAANILMGKNKAEFTPNINTGDKVVITNAEKIVITGKKRTDKVYYHYTGYPGGLREETFEHLANRKPTEVIIKAIRGMLPKNKLQKERMKNLYVYAGPEHPHQGQQAKEQE